MLLHIPKVKVIILLKASIIFLVAFLIGGILVSKFSVGFNDTDSISGKVFLIVKNTYPENKMDKIVFKINNSNTNHKDKILIKKVIGFEGDTINVKNNHIFLNENDVGIIKSKSISGKFIYPIIENNKSVRIPQNHYFTHSPHKDSYDSRYISIGLIANTNIIGVAYEIF
jgi:signal peptidase I